MPLTNHELALVFALFGLTYLLAVSWPLAVTDIREFRLPNRLILPGFGVALAGQLLALVSPNWRLPEAIALTLVVFAGLLFANLKGLLGMGDVKLSALIALNLGWFDPQYVALALASALALAGLAVLGAVALGRGVLGTRIALGPYLLAGFGLGLAAALATVAGGS